MRLFGDTTWQEVFRQWEEREGHDMEWTKFAQAKGWPDWKSWRWFSAAMMKLPELAWQEREFTNPLTEIPGMLMGPFNGWQSLVVKKNESTFDDLIDIPKQLEFWSQHPKIHSLIADFPAQAEFIGLIREDTGRLVCYEGHHRAVAIAVAKKQGLSIPLTGPIKIAVARIPIAEANLFNDALARGTSKQPRIN